MMQKSLRRVDETRKWWPRDYTCDIAKVIFYGKLS